MVIEKIVGFFENFINSFPEEYKVLAVLSLYTFFIVGYTVFIWKFYRFLSSKDILHLNLNQYNYSKHPKLEKFLVVCLYIIEYMVILPFLVLFWFSILSIFLLLLSETGDIQQILMISAAIIAAVRVTAYIQEDLSKEIAKILPFTVLAMFIMKADLFDATKLFKSIIEIPQLFSHIFMFIVFIFFIEFVLRIVYLGVQVFVSEEERVEEVEDGKKG